MTVTLAGTVAAALSLVNVTFLCAVVPTAGAFNVSVPVGLVIPPGALVGLSVIKATEGRLMVSTKFWTALEPTPLLAVNVMLYVPAVPAAGIPLNI